MSTTKKFDWQSVTDDFEKMQQTSGVAGALGIAIAIVITITSRIPRQNLINIWITIGIITLFSAIYYLIPKLYLNKKLIILPDIFFVFGIASMMYNAGNQGEVFVMFLIFLIAVDAFMFTSQLFYIVLWSIVAIFLFDNFFMGNFSSAQTARTVIFELYGILSVGIILRNFAEKGISLKESREDLAKKTKQLKSQKKEIYLIINNLSEGFIAVDKDKNITFINKTAIKLLGMIVNSKRLIGKNIDIIFPVAGVEGKISIVEEALTKKESALRDDLRLVRADRTIRIHTNSAPIFDENNNLAGALVLFRDITSKKELDEQRAEFNAIASHELRTPLTVLEGYLYYLKSDKKLKYDPKTGEYIDKSYQAAEALLNLSNDILTVIKADENQIKLALEEVDLSKLIREVVTEFKEKTKEKKIVVETQIPKNLPKAKSDKQKLKEILINLVENAIKFTDKGKIIIKIEAENQKKLVVSVKDSGIGIKQEDQEMIFHKFYRTEDWQTRKTGGSGLGLFIAKTFIERLGGSIWVESKANEGSTFYFTVPLEIRKNTIKRGEKQLSEFIKSI